MTIWGMLGWLSTLTSATGFMLNIKKKKSCFIVWQAGTIMIVYNFLFGRPDQMVYYATATLFAFYGVMNVIGYLQWKKEEK